MAGQSLFVLASSLLKISILVSYLRIFQKDHSSDGWSGATFGVVVAAMVYLLYFALDSVLVSQSLTQFAFISY